MARPSLREEEPSLDTVWHAVVTGDLARARSYAQQIDEEALSPEDKALYELFTRRVELRCWDDGEGLSTWLSHVLAAYRTYWIDALQSAAPQQVKQALLNQLCELCELPPLSSWEHVEDILHERARDEGVYLLLGRTLPLRECMIWRGQDLKHFAIKLPLDTTQLPVYMLSDFVSRGWCAFLCADAQGAGGWVKDHALYCVAEAWDLNSEAFVASYLGHEGQHHWDRQHLPWLEQPELEYRAKLAELALAQTTQESLWRKFVKSHEVTASQDVLPGREQSPHALAEYWLIEDLGGADAYGAELEQKCKTLLRASAVKSWRGCPAS